MKIFILFLFLSFVTAIFGKSSLKAEIQNDEPKEEEGSPVPEILDEKNENKDEEKDSAKDEELATPLLEQLKQLHYDRYPYKQNELNDVVNYISDFLRLLLESNIEKEQKILQDEHNLKFLEQQTSDMSEEITKKDEQLVNSDKEISDLKKSNEEGEQEKQKLKQEIDNVTEEKAQLDKDHVKLQKAKAKEEKKNQKLKDKNNALKETININTDEFKNKMSVIMEALTDMQSKFTKLEDDLQILNKLPEDENDDEDEEEDGDKNEEKEEEEAEEKKEEVPEEEKKEEEGVDDEKKNGEEIKADGENPEIN